MGDVAHDRPLVLAAEPAQPIAHVGDEALAALLAVVADVDAGGELRGDDMAGGVGDGRRQHRVVDRLAALARDQQIEQRPRPRQTAGVGGEDAVAAVLHAGVITANRPAVHRRALARREDM